nr:hypothetical protein [Pantoea cypripedii]
MPDRIGFPFVNMAISSARRGNNRPAPRLPVARLSQLTLLPASNNPQMPVAPPSYDGYSGPSDFQPPQAYTNPLSYEESQHVEEIRQLGARFQALFEKRPPIFSQIEIIHPDKGREILEKHKTFYFEKIKLQDELQIYLRMAGVRHGAKIVGKEIPVFNVIKDVPTYTLRNMGGVKKLHDLAKEYGEVSSTIERPGIMSNTPKGVLIADRSYAQGDSSEVVREIIDIWGRLELRIDEDSLNNSSSVYKPELQKILEIIKNRSAQPMDTRL